MECFHPVRAFQLEDGTVVFSEQRKGGVARSLDLRCGQCRGCRLERSRQWAIRCMHEASQHERNSFVTLTYDAAHVPAGGSLNYRDFQLFIKRVRRRSRLRVRFYMAGEYGERFDRPHYHALLFGIDFGDKVYLGKSPSGERLYCSKELELLWPLGWSSVGAVTFQSAAYVARYVMKKVTGDLAEDHYRVVDEDTGEVIDRVPEFNRMSLKPGIGMPWLDRFYSDVFPHSGMVVVDGREVRAPRFYDKVFEKRDAVGASELSVRRELVAYRRRGDSTPERLAVKEEVLEARLGRLKRVI